MENISLKQWIVAGTLSGVVVGLLLFLILSFIFLNIPFWHPIFIWEIFYNSLFFGIIIGIILFLGSDKLSGGRRLPKYLFVAIVTSALMAVFSLFFYELFFSVYEGSTWLPWLIPFISIGHLYLGMFYFGFFGFFIYPLSTGTAFGFLINYFITRMERKVSN